MVDLVWFDRAREAIQKAAQIDEVKDIRDKAEALRLYTKQAGDGLQMQNWCAEIKIRAERRAGELLKDIPRSKGGRPKRNSSQPETSLGTTLKETGIPKPTANRWQRIAELPEYDFEKHIAETKASGAELTTSSVEREVRKHKEPEQSRKPKKEPPKETTPPQNHGTPYIKWLTVLSSVSTLLEDLQKLGGIKAITKNLTPVQSDSVIEQIYRVDHYIKRLVVEAKTVGQVIDIKSIYR